MNENACYASVKVACVFDSRHSTVARKPRHHGARMYRIELSPGEETVFRSIEELAVAIKRGVVSSRARIYHNACNKWLPIQFHPHYKAAASMPLSQAELVAGPPMKPLSTLHLQVPAVPNPVQPIPMAAASSSIFPQASASRPVDEPARAKKHRRSSSKPRRQLRVALVGALLLGGAQWILSAPLFSRPEASALIRAQRQLISVPTEAMKRVSSPNSAAMIPVLPETVYAPTTPPLDVTSHPRAQAPSFGGTAPAVQPAELPIEPTPAVNLSAPATPNTDSLGIQVSDSSQARISPEKLRSLTGARSSVTPAASRR